MLLKELLTVLKKCTGSASCTYVCSSRAAQTIVPPVDSPPPVLATCGIRRLGEAIESTPFHRSLLAASSEAEYNGQQGRFARQNVANQHNGNIDQIVTSQSERGRGALSPGSFSACQYA